MKKSLIGMLSLFVVVALAGCGGSTPEANSDGGDRGKGSVESKAGSDGGAKAKPAMKGGEEGSGSAEKAPAAAPAAAPAPAAKTEEEKRAAKKGEPAPAEEKVEEAAAPVMDGLVGSKWTYEEIELTFKEGNKVHLKGGPLAALAPDGTDADYTLKDGAIEVSVMGETYSGTFDGEKLIVDGTEAVKAQ
jgi:hypothetical protein